MSRIHEALKKAARERSAQLGDRPETDLVDLATETGSLPGDAGQREEAKPRAALTSAEIAQRATFGTFAKRCARPAWNTEFSLAPFAGNNDQRVVVERFRTLRSRLYQIAAAQPLRSLLITSSLPMEGKTFIAANLAQSYVRQTDRRVLLSDEDLRAPRLHLTLGAPEGLSANNVIPARVAGLRHLEGLVDVELLAGTARIFARITEASAVRLSLAVGMGAYAVVKAVTVDTAMAIGD